MITELKSEKAGNFIYYNGRYWMIELFNPTLYGGGYFAIPIYFTKDNQVEVRHAGGNWCYISNGAILKNPEKQVMIQVYESHLEHLQWCKKIQIENTPYYKETNSKINEQIFFYKKLLKKIA